MDNKLIVVVGATGRQGKVTTKTLLENGYGVRVLVRDPLKAKQFWPNSNVEIFEGDLQNEFSLEGLFNNAYGLFFALPFAKNSVEYGKNLLNATKGSSLEHVIYSSVGGVDRNTKVDHFNYKREIESYLKSLGRPYTILRPAGFMEEFAKPSSIRAITGLLKLYMPDSKKFQLISLQDIAKFVEIAFSNPAEYLGQEIEIAGDELSLTEVFEKISKVTNVELTPMKFPSLIKLVLPKIMKQMFVFYAEDGWRANLQSLRQINPELLSFEGWLNKTDTHYRQ